MASKSNNNRGTKSSAGRKSVPKNSGSKTRSNSKTSKRNDVDYRNLVTVDDSIRDEAVLLCILAFCVLLYIALFGALGQFGEAVRKVLFGIFGLVSYVVPFALFMSSAFFISNKGKGVAYVKVIAVAVVALIVAAFCEMIFDHDFNAEKISEFYRHCSEIKGGGGILGGMISYSLKKAIGSIGTVILLLFLLIISIVLITEKSFVGGVKKGSKTIYRSAKDNSERVRVRRDEKRREREAYLKEHPKEEKKLRRDMKVSGVMKNPTLAQSLDTEDDIHEISADSVSFEAEETPVLPNINVKTVHSISYSANEDNGDEEIFDDDIIQDNDNIVEATDRFTRRNEEIREYSDNTKGINADPSELPSEARFRIHEPVISDVTDDSEITEESFENPTAVNLDFDKLNITGENIVGHGEIKDVEKQTDYGDSSSRRDSIEPVKKPVKRKSAYKFPRIDFLKPGKKNENVETVEQLKETAAKLQSTLATFGVNVTMTDIAQGPSVTRYEMQPEVGTKVSKILNLQDDIKLNMAAQDVRIEAPIPGKPAVGIEIPNKVVSMVSFRDLIESKNFKEAESKLSFAVGKDLSGSTVVADIAKMPHMLIAGSTGSGKSVCINTLIMSIIYKATPDEVKLIMVDPKVVELSVYNGIPHLLIPVVTDPKKAAAALNWGVAEMNERYKKFAEFGVRDLKGYNKKLETRFSDLPQNERPEKLPQIVIIVDELADLMMVASNEVETSICRLAQLARAAGIHLIIATQRPSVDVITGLIKANMPSRVAFAVSSGVDSRTILDMNGAERLLGKGDMLFYPQGYTKPSRVQGAFISDDEILDIVEYLRTQSGGVDSYNEDVMAKVESQASGASDGGNGSGGDSSGSDRDQYFVDAAKLVIDSGKASIGALQRKYRIGFNRAARIMDQLYEAGVVSAEEGTKPRKVLMSMEQFENALEEGDF